MKTIIITGGGTGIGLATARRLIKDGYRVICGGLDHEDDLPEEMTFIKTDVSSEDDLQALFAQADRIDGIVNCAGIILQEQEWQKESFQRVLDVNLTASLCIGNLALEQLIENKGSVVNLASMWNFFGSPKSPGYAASKAALGALTRSMATAWGPKGVRVNAIAPGWVDTRMGAGARNDPQRNAKITERIPLGRWANPSEIAAVIAFLISDDASYIHGATLPIDGGYSIA